MSAIGNLIWFLLGGILMGLFWTIIGALALISIIGIPWARACFVIAKFSFFPFGQEAIDREELTHREDLGTSEVGVVGNVIWFLIAGFWLAFAHLVWAVACFVSIIGIPFSIQHIKLAGVAIAPIGKTIVDKEVAQAARMANAEAELSRYRR